MQISTYSLQLNKRTKGSSVLGFFRKTQSIVPIYIYFIYGDLLWRIGSHNCEGQEVPWPAICKQETQKSRWCSSSPFPEAWEPGLLMVEILVQGQEKTNVQAKQKNRKKKGWIPIPSSSIQVLNRLNDPSPHWGVNLLS